MWVPHSVPRTQAGRSESKNNSDENLIVLQPPTSISHLTLLDTDPDPETVPFEEYPYDWDLDRDRESESEEEEIIDRNAEFWNGLSTSDNHQTPLVTSDTPFDSPIIDFEATVPPYTGDRIEFSSIRQYRDLFKWDFQQYSFPSRQIRVAKTEYKGKEHGKGKAKKSFEAQTGKDEETRRELERFKKEAQAALGKNPAAPSFEPETWRYATATIDRVPLDITEDKQSLVKEAKKHRRPSIQADKVLIGDLLGDFVQERSTSLLEMEDDQPRSRPTSRGRGRGGGYPSTGPIRLETSRPLTPYKDNPDSSSSRPDSRGSEGRKRQTARRGKPFPSSSSRGVGGAGAVKDIPLAQRLGERILPNKASTQSLPSKSNPTSAMTSHHRPSMPSSSIIRPPAIPTRGSTDLRSHPGSPYFELISKRQARATAPGHLYLPSRSELQRSIMRSWTSTRASPETQQAIIELLGFLSTTINDHLCYQPQRGHRVRRFEVDVFGSVAWGGETGVSGDLDLVVLDRELAQGYHPDLWRVQPGETPPPIKRSQRSYQAPASLPNVYDLWKFSAMLRRIGMQEVTCIRHASTPIIKFKSVSNGIKLDCDVNVNDLGGWYNSSLILAYCEISPFVLRPLVHALKLWASAQDLNDPSGAKGPATMSSYCLTLLAIGYLQQRGHLPNLQAGINVPIPSLPADTSDPDLIWVTWGKSQGIPAHIAFRKTPPPEWVQADKHLLVSDAIRGFFRFFSSEGGFDRENDVISILNGGVIPRSERYNSPLVGGKEERIKREPYMGTGLGGIQPSNWRERLLVVQDPFIWQKSCTSAMHLKGLERWFATVDRTHNLLQMAGADATLNDLLIPPPAPVQQQQPANPGGGGGGGKGRDRIKRYADKMNARGNGKGGGAGVGSVSTGTVGGGSVAGPPTEKLLDI